jgi:nucleotidyltransferase substrate binding protein (TIGR01987 family)
MTRLSLESLEKALTRLEEGFGEAALYPQLLTLRDGVIQRFEVSMDLSWKLLQRALKEIYRVEEGAILTRKDVFRQAARHHLIESAETWLGHYEARNRTSHLYDSTEAVRTFERARSFLADARITLERLRNAA